MLHDSQIPRDGTLLTRFKIRRLRLAMPTVSHTEGNRATTTNRGETGALAVQAKPVERWAPSPVQPRDKTEHFRCSYVIALLAASVPVFPHASETLIDVRHPQLSIDRMRRRPKASCHHVRKMDLR